MASNILCSITDNIFYMISVLNEDNLFFNYSLVFIKVKYKKRNKNTNLNLVKKTAI